MDANEKISLKDLGYMLVGSIICFVLIVIGKGDE